MAVQAYSRQYPAWPVDFQSTCFQGEPDFDFQEFRDAVDSFISDPSSLMPPLLDPADFSFPVDDGRPFSPCIPLPAQEDPLSQMNVETISSSEQYWKDLADHNQKALGDALVENNQVLLGCGSFLPGQLDSHPGLHPSK